MLLEFQSSAFDRSATSPFNALQLSIKVKHPCCGSARSGEKQQFEF
jgi:hypothetical protein